MVIFLGTLEPAKNIESEGLLSLIQAMLQKDPEKRPSVREILKNPELQAKAKELRISLPFKRRLMSPAYNAMHKILKKSNIKHPAATENHKSQRSVLMSRNSSSNGLSKVRKTLKSKGNSVVLAEKCINDNDFFIQLSNQYQTDMFKTKTRW